MQTRRKRHSLIRSAVLAAVAAIVLAQLPPAGAAAEATETAEPAARVSGELAEWVATAAAGDVQTVIVTFHEAADVDRIDAYSTTAQKLDVLPVAIATLSGSQIRDLAGDPAVRSLWHDAQQEIYLDSSVPLTGADRVWAGEGLQTGYTGAGVGIGVVDTGVDGLHPDLPYPEKVEPYLLVGDLEDPQLVTEFEAPTGDSYGHGTHVSSIAAGLGAASDGTYTGMAPGARVYSFKTDVGLFLFTGYILKSFDWMLEHRAANNIRVSTNSWGSGGGTDFDPDDPVNVATRALFDAGITVIFSAGNDGEPDSLNQYATAPWVIGVAANDKQRELAAFSSRGRIDGNWDRNRALRDNTGLYRPGLSAPGVDITAAGSSHATVLAPGRRLDNPMYIVASGTSMSAPHVAGAAALMYEADPDLTPEQVISILEHTASEMPGYETFEVGAGHLDAHAAVQVAEATRRGFPPIPRGGGGEYEQLESHAYGGVAMPGSFSLSDCSQGEDHTYASYHEFTVTEDADAILVSLEWEDEQQLIYLFLYDPDCTEAASSASLLDLVFTRNERVLMVTNPDAGDWTVGVYGRVNLPTSYEGSFATFTQR